MTQYLSNPPLQFHLCCKNPVSSPLLLIHRHLQRRPDFKIWHTVWWVLGVGLFSVVYVASFVNSQRVTSTEPTSGEPAMSVCNSEDAHSRSKDVDSRFCPNIYNGVTSLKTVVFTYDVARTSHVLFLLLRLFRHGK